MKASELPITLVRLLFTERLGVRVVVIFGEISEMKIYYNLYFEREKEEEVLGKAMHHQCH